MKRILSLLLLMAAPLLAQSPPPQTALFTFGGSFPCQAGLLQFCDGAPPMYMLMISDQTGLPGYSYTVTATLQNGNTSVVSGSVVGLDPYGWLTTGPLNFGGAVVSYTVSTSPFYGHEWRASR
jgi:hypothetical protein